MITTSFSLANGMLSEERNRPLAAAALFCLVALALWGGSSMQFSLDNLMLLWPSGAVAIGGLWLLGWVWGVPALLLGAVAGGILNALETPQMIASVVAVLISGSVGSFAMFKLRVDPRLPGLRDMLLFLAFAVVFAPLLGNLAAAGMHRALGVDGPGPDFIWWHCGVAEMIACLLLLPIVFGQSDEDANRRSSMLTFGIATLIGGCVIYFDLLPTQLSMTLPLAYITFPVMLAAAFHLSSRFVAGLLLCNGLLALWGTANSMGPFTLLSSSESIVALQGHLALLSCTSLLLSAALADRRRSLEAQKRSEERYRLIVEHQSEALLKTDATGAVLYATPSAKEWLPEEVEENFLRWLSEHCEGSSYVSMRASLMSGERTTHDFINGDSTLRWILSPVRSSTGALEAVIAVGHDVTVECAAEQRAHQHLDELSHLGRLSDMAQMAGGLAHELNQPLTAVMTFAQAAERLLPPDADTKDTRQALARVVGNTQRAADIVRQARNFMGNKNAEHQVQDMLQVVRDGISLVDFDTRRHGVKLTLAPLNRIPHARVSSVQIHQILVNLVRNSIQSLAAQKTEKLITIRLDQDSERMWMDVVDNGPGISATAAENAFDPFSGTRGDGLGLGLSICKAIAESHGGSIRFQPVDKGACVRLILPLDARDDDDDDEVAELLATIA